jgi:hypothetical protein
METEEAINAGNMNESEPKAFDAEMSLHKGR